MGRSLVLGLGVAVNIWLFLLAAQPAVLLKVAFLDVGQGDAIYIEATNGNKVLIDGGRDRRVLRSLGEVMPWWDKTLDVVIATHPDADHIGGLPAVLERYEVAGLLVPGVAAGTQAYHDFTSAVAAEEGRGAKLFRARRGGRLDLGGGVVLDLLWPPPAGASEINAQSVVARLTDGYHVFLLTGDAPAVVEKTLLKSGAPLMAQVLKVGHHGSRTSTDQQFLTAVAPRYAIISAGRDNRYGHPHREVVERISQQGADLLLTSDKGTIICESRVTTLACG